VTGLWRLRVDGEVRLARGTAAAGPTDLLVETSIDRLLGEAGSLERALGETDGPVPPGATTLVPVESQEVWGAGVTYRRSRDARIEEATVPDHYDRVYEAERPELFIKATPGRVRGPGEAIGIRADSTWDVPEPELALVADVRGRVVAYVIGNDVSSRSIEGENPLYLPQAKTYVGSCALGPCLVPTTHAPSPHEMEVSLRIERDGAPAFEGSVRVAEMRRTPAELVDWLFRGLDFPFGVVLLTGTGIVPSSDFTLGEGDEVSISISGLGELRNPVRVVGGV
jgi:2-dehydro-3-deoxy-D-arabinonate dehydratase